MKVLLVTNIFPPMIGGPASFIDRLAARLSDLGHEVTVVCSSDQPRDAGDRNRGFRVVRVVISNRYKYEVVVRLVLAWQLLRHRRVFVNGLESYVRPIAALLGRTYVLKVVGDYVWEQARNRGATTLDIDAFQMSPGAQQAFAGMIAERNSWWLRAGRVVTPSEYLRGLVIGWGVPPERVTVIKNGIDPQRAPTRRQIAPDEPLRAVFVGRLTNWKGVDTLILATARNPKVRVRVLGDGPALPSLHALAAQLGVTDRVDFAGRQSPECVKQALVDADALVLPSLYEGLSHTLLEAMALGCPCVASPRGGNNELIEDGVSGLLVEPLDPPALADALERLRCDGALRARISSGAVLRASAFAFEHTVRETEKAILNGKRD